MYERVEGYHASGEFFPCNEKLHVLRLNAAYTKANVATEIKEFLDIVHDTDAPREYCTELGQKTMERINDVRFGAESEVLYMTFAQKVQEERLESAKEIQAEMLLKFLADGFSAEFLRKKMDLLSDEEFNKIVVQFNT